MQRAGRWQDRSVYLSPVCKITLDEGKGKTAVPQILLHAALTVGIGIIIKDTVNHKKVIVCISSSLGFYCRYELIKTFIESKTLLHLFCTDKKRIPDPSDEYGPYNGPY